ncbi:hypothetical protein BJ508DRAFT_155415 [Ascobolus immersus RN42]|uniref:Uncharacterized protein n=1 Tax=Ascobolus immersus RN42 TaxID=1160509 RepID=A0A3N4HZL2_ASCIM|nr:hypothetical protein BJ508DRAFT_155415 [Ascobolus immersus RN42]
MSEMATTGRKAHFLPAIIVKSQQTMTVTFPDIASPALVEAIFSHRAESLAASVVQEGCGFTRPNHNSGMIPNIGLSSGFSHTCVDKRYLQVSAHQCCWTQRQCLRQRRQDCRTRSIRTHPSFVSLSDVVSTGYMTTELPTFYNTIIPFNFMVLLHSHHDLRRSFCQHYERYITTLPTEGREPGVD